MLETILPDGVDPDKSANVPAAVPDLPTPGSPVVYIDRPQIPPPIPESIPDTDDTEKWAFPFAAYNLSLHKVVPKLMSEASRWIVWAYWFYKGVWKKEPRSTLAREQAKPIDAAQTKYHCTIHNVIRLLHDLMRHNPYGRRESTKRNPRILLDGIGFVLGGGFAGIDLDDCLIRDDAGNYRLAPWAQAILDRFPETYAEVSPSRTGVKIFLLGRLADDLKGRKWTGMGDDGRGAVEIYDRGRYFTVTGLVVKGREGKLAELGDQLNALHAELSTRGGERRAEADDAAAAEVTPRPAGTQDDEALLAKARTCKNGVEFSALFDAGDISAYDRDDSAADLALCSFLAFWTGRDPAWMDRLFRRSALYREKWDRADYREATIRKAIETTKNVYSGRLPRTPSGPAAAAAGKANTVVCGGGARRPKLEDQALAGILEQVEAAVAAKNPAAIYTDNKLIQSLAILYTADHGAYLGAMARLREVKGFRTRGFEKLIKAQEPPDVEQVTPVDNPHALARSFAEQFYVDEDASPHKCRTAQHHKGITYEWIDGRYVPRSDDELKAEISAFTELVFEAHYHHALEEYAENQGDETSRPTLRPVTETLVKNVFGALRSLLLVPERSCPDMPAWLGDGHPDWRPEDVLPTRNALVHLPSVIAGAGDATIKPTPRLFSGFCVDYDYEPVSVPPAEWRTFLDSCFPGDQESIDTLQEYFGYCLSSDTRQHKMLMLCGPPRSGKGTIIRAFTRVIGAANRVAASLHDLGGNFSLSTWLGKQVAVLNEARLSGRTDTAAIAARLLAISGEDDVSVDIKYKYPWIGRLGTRIILVGNDVPSIADPSGALANRFIFLHFSQSFLGREDLGLDARLAAEAPEILNWCIEGLARLQKRGHFVQPESGLILKEQFMGLSSKITEFVDEMCVRGAEQECAKDVLFQAYGLWCEANNTHCGSMQQFCKDLYAACPGVGETQKNIEGDRPRFFRGIALAESSRVMTAAAWWLKGVLTRHGCDVKETHELARKAGFKPWEIEEAARILGVHKETGPFPGRGKYSWLPGFL